MSNQIWQKRFEQTSKLTDSLQGHIYLAKDLHNSGENVVVKETYKRCVEAGKSLDGNIIQEDFHNETKVLTYLSKQTDTNEGFCHILSEWESEHCYYYAMQWCEAPLFEYVLDAFTEDGIMYNYISKEENKPQIPCDNNAHPWLINIRNIFKQLVQSVYWMHTKGVCHLDLSLENTMLYKMDELKTKIIDFGLAKHFDKNDNNFSNDQRVGKRGYMAPEVYTKQTYDAGQADVWCLGVMLFKMLMGAPPYKRPIERDTTFEYIINGKLEEVIRHWRRLRLISKDALDCMEKIFKWEKDRITIEELMRHPFVDLAYLLQECKNDCECEDDNEISDIVSDTSNELVLLGDFNDSLRYDSVENVNVKGVLSVCVVNNFMENMKNEELILIDNSVMICNEKVLFDVINNDAHRLTVQIMYEIYIYFVYIFGNDEMKSKKMILLYVWQFNI